MSSIQIGQEPIVLHKAQTHSHAPSPQDISKASLISPDCCCIPSTRLKGKNGGWRCFLMQWKPFVVSLKHSDWWVFSVILFLKASFQTRKSSELVAFNSCLSVSKFCVLIMTQPCCTQVSGLGLFQNLCTTVCISPFAFLLSLSAPKPVLRLFTCSFTWLHADIPVFLYNKYIYRM